MKKILNLIYSFLIKELHQMEMRDRRRRFRRCLIRKEQEVFDLLLDVQPKGLFCICIYDLMSNYPERFYEAVKMIYDQARSNPYDIARYISMDLVEKAVILWEGDDEIEQLGDECGFYLSNAS